VNVDTVPETVVVVFRPFDDVLTRSPSGSAQLCTALLGWGYCTSVSTLKAGGRSARLASNGEGCQLASTVHHRLCLHSGVPDATGQALGKVDTSLTTPPLATAPW